MPVPRRRRRPVEETILHALERPVERLVDRPVERPPGEDPEVPIYAELARRWQAEGRAVPGLPDPVWEALAAPGGT